MYKTAMNIPLAAPTGLTTHQAAPRPAAALLPCKCHLRRQIGSLHTLRAVESPEAEAVLPSPAANEAEDAAAAAPAPAATPQRSQRKAPYFVASFLWLEKTVAVCVDQVFAEGQRSPLTEYFMWPHGDAWEKLKTSLDAKPWIKEADKNELLNGTTAVIEYWQDEPRHSIDAAREQFPDYMFQGY